MRYLCAIGFLAVLASSLTVIVLTVRAEWPRILRALGFQQ